MGLGQDEEGDGGTEEEKGGVILEEVFEGFESPIMMSPVGSVVSDTLSAKECQLAIALSSYLQTEQGTQALQIGHSDGEEDDVF